MLLIAVLSILTAGCSSKTPEPKVEYKYIDRVVTKYLPTECEAPHAKCSVDMNSTYTQKIHSMDKCIEDLTTANGVYR